MCSDNAQAFLRALPKVSLLISLRSHGVSWKSCRTVERLQGLAKRSKLLDTDFDLPLQCEHHMHIEGSLEPGLLFELAKNNGVTLDPSRYTTIPALEERYKNFTSLDDFLL